MSQKDFVDTGGYKDMVNDIQQKPEELGIFSWDDPNEVDFTRAEKRALERKVRKKYQREVDRERVNYIPGPLYGPGGANRKNNFFGRIVSVFRTRRTTSYVLAAAYPFVASGSLGVPGVYIGSDEMGGGGFYFDPWELYAAGVITGMSMIALGGVGKGKSTLVKSLVCRLVQAGRLGLVMTDKKGEWVPVAHYLGGDVISVGQGSGTRINPLDAGNRPKLNVDGQPLSDEEWAQMVRERRLSLMNAICVVTEGRELTSAESNVLAIALDEAQAKAALEGRTVIIPDLLDEVRSPAPELLGRASRAEAFEQLANTLERLVEGDLKGMFDGASTVEFNPWAPITVFNTRSFANSSDKVKKIAYACIQTWAEAAVTTDEYGQRIVVYEEGMEALNDAGSLQRMITQVKLARAYGLFNVLVLHKLSDLDMAGDEGSASRASAYSLLGDSSVQVVYHQNKSERERTIEKLGLSERQWDIVSKLKQGQGLWLLEGKPFKVQNRMSKPEEPVFNTNAAMEIAKAEDAKKKERVAA
ncbi:helicase HerA domain-containing protein [Rothia sp. P4278]|uniref:helicase HerA domain-containing protein n=1 Tax=Rothia sp. P4278 TaxID=3402658 RepID=UPI003AE73619